MFSAFVNSYLSYAVTVWGEKDTKNRLNLQNKIVKKYNIKDILFVNKLCSYRKIEFARCNKLELNKLNSWGKCMYYKYLLINANDFKTLYNQENFNKLPVL